MVNILLEGYDIDKPWVHSALVPYIHPESRVCILAFSFRDNVKTPEDWDTLYRPSSGKYYSALVKPFSAFGIEPDQIRFINYFTDTPETARSAIAFSDIVFLPGGLPDRMMDRIHEFGLAEPLRTFPGVMMGYSAGALVQLTEYHLSPDDDYPAFQYGRGLGCISGFYLEVHYENLPAQNDAIQRVRRERNAPVYAAHEGNALIIINSDETTVLGECTLFD